MSKEPLTFNDLPQVVAELRDEVSGMNALLLNLQNRPAQQRENRHRPVTPEQVAEYTKIPLATIYQKLANREIPGFKPDKQWDKDRKTIPKLIEAMETLGISSSQEVGDNRIHTLHAFSGWYVDGMFVKNPFATRRNLPTVTPSCRPSRSVTPKPTSTQTKVQPSVQPKPTPAKTVFNIDTGSEVKKVWIPDSVKDFFLNEALVPEGNEIATVENVAHTAMLLFAGYINAATSMSESCGGGGGSTPESGRGKKDDEDERSYARRCLQMAHSMYKPKSVKRGFHR